jgi:hypothetical protein
MLARSVATLSEFATLGRLVNGEAAHIEVHMATTTKAKVPDKIEHHLFLLLDMFP